MKKVLAAVFILLSLNCFSKEVSIEGGYLNSTNESSYSGIYIQGNYTLYEINETIYISGSPFMHIISGKGGRCDPGLMFDVFKEFYFCDRWKAFVYGGIGVMYLNTTSTKQHDNFNFKENLGAGISYQISKDVQVQLKATIWHISNAGSTDSNSGINGNTIGLSLSKSL